MIKPRIVWMISLLGSFAFLFFSNQDLALILFVIVAVIPVVSIIVNQIVARNVSISIDMPQTSEKNQQFSCNIIAKNSKPFFFSLVNCKFSIKNEVIGEVTVGELIFPLGGKNDNCIVPFILDSKFCGSIVINVKSVKIYDLFGLAGVKGKIPVTSETIVLPDTFSPQLVVSAYKAKDVEADDYSQTKAGFDPSETFAIRDYRPGDSLNRIHWKLTEKFDEILVREAGLPVRHSFLVLFETSIPSTMGEEATIDDALLEIMMSLCQKMTEEEISYEIGWQDYTSNSFFRCGVSNLDELSGIANKLMHTCYKRDDVNAFSYFSDSYGDANFEHVVYISRFVPETFGQFENESHASAVICSCDQNIAGALEIANLKLYVCTPENYERELFALAI